MGKVSLRVGGVAVWCLLGAACLARGETESEGTAGAAGSAATGSAPLCGVENTERIADVVCGVTAAWCERLAGCCQVAGFAGTAGDCRAQQGTVCVERVRANLAAGACFDVAAYDPACDELTLESIARCSTAGPAATRPASARYRAIPALPARMIYPIAAAGCAGTVPVSNSAAPAVQVTFPAAPAETVATTDCVTNVRSPTRASATSA